MRILIVLAALAAVPAQADVSDSGNLSIGGNGVIAGTMTVQGNAFSIGASTLVVSGGRVGIGTAGPGTNLEIVGANQTFDSGIGNLRITTSDSETINKGGDITFGGSYTGTTPTWWAAISGRKTNGTDGQYGGYLQFVTRNAALGYHESMRIDEAGYVGIGTSSPSSPLHVNGTLKVEGQLLLDAANETTGVIQVGCSNNAGEPTKTCITATTFTNQNTNMFSIYNSTAAPNLIGSIQAQSNSTAFNTTSDRRLKEKVLQTTRGLDTLRKIDVDDYNFISDTTTRLQGLIAQDLYRYYPEAVSVGGGDPRKNPWMIDYGRLTPLLLQSIKDLSVKVDELQARVTALEQKQIH
jgi:hypothetical protein